MGDLDRLRRVLDVSGDPQNPPARRLKEVITSVSRVAVVGLSRDPAKAARRVPSYMATKGYDIIPVNPFADRILGKPARRHLDEVTEVVDMVLVFRPSTEAGAVLELAAARPERPVIWLQEGIRADSAAAKARADGLTIVQDLCFYQAHRALTEDQLRAFQGSAST